MARLQIKVMFEFESEDVHLCKSEFNNYTDYYLDSFIKALYNQGELNDLHMRTLNIAPKL